MPRYLYLNAHRDGGLRLYQTEEGFAPIGPHNAAQVAERLRNVAEILEMDATWRHIPTVLPAAVARWEERERQERDDLADAAYEASTAPHPDERTPPDADLMAAAADWGRR